MISAITVHDIGVGGMNDNGVGPDRALRTQLVWERFQGFGRKYRRPSRVENAISLGFGILLMGLPILLGLHWAGRI